MAYEFTAILYILKQILRCCHEWQHQHCVSERLACGLFSGRARLGGRLWQVRGTSWSAATNATLVNLHMIESFDEVVNVPVS